MPPHNHQLEDSGRTHASCMAGIPAVVVASTLAMIADFGPNFHQQTMAIVAPIAEIVSTVLQCHTPLVRRMIVTREAPRVAPAGSHGFLLPALKQLTSIKLSKTVHIIQLHIFCGMSRITK